MKLAGMPIPDMTAADMQSKTPKITASEAQPGDLLIWNDGKHVEIVVSASGNQVKTIGSASSRGGVSEGNHPLAGKTIHRNTL
jgi:cell wall-associated NlpC family hydrolase